MESRLNLLEAHLAVRKAELDEQETADYSAFIDHFPKAIFFANTREALDDFQKDQRIKLLAWFLEWTPKCGQRSKACRPGQPVG